MHGAEVWIVRGDPVGQLVQRGLAEQHGAGGLQPLHHGGVVIRHVVRKELRAARGADAPGAKHVLDCHGDAMQRPAYLTVLPLFVASSGIGERPLGCDRDEGVEFRV